MSRKKSNRQAPNRCDTCGNAECRARQEAVCWTRCSGWKPETLSANDADAEEHMERILQLCTARRKK